MWPSDAIVLYSKYRVITWIQLSDLTLVFSPNTVTLRTAAMIFNQGYFSKKIEFPLTTTNPLKSGYSIWTSKNSGEFLFLLLGTDQNPPCQIVVGAVTYTCRLILQSNEMGIELLQDVPAGNLDISIYGLSIGTVVSTNSCTMAFLTYSDAAGTDSNRRLDTTGAGVFLTVTYDSVIPSGSLTLADLTSNIWQKKAYADIEFRIIVNNRDILRNDFISINLGAGTESTYSQTVYCEVVRSDDTAMIEPRATICSTENLENIEIKFSQDMLDREFIVKLYNLEMPKSATPGLMGYYMFNGDYTAFASSQLNWSTLTNTLQDYSQIIEPVVMKWYFDGRGVRADLVITVTPNLNIDTSKVFYIKFSPEFLSNLSIFEIYTYVESDKSV